VKNAHQFSVIQLPRAMVMVNVKRMGLANAQMDSTEIPVQYFVILQSHATIKESVLLMELANVMPCFMEKLV